MRAWLPETPSYVSVPDGIIHASRPPTTRKASRPSHLVRRKGKLKDYPTNRKATAIWYALSTEIAGRDTLSGTVFFTGAGDEHGNVLPVPHEIVELWREIGEK